MRMFADTGMRLLVLVSLLAMFLLGRRFPRAVAGWLFGVIAGGLLSGNAWIAAAGGLLGAAIGAYLDHVHWRGRKVGRKNGRR
ncbi:MAG: hypothetical protein RL291_1679 [Pseudomonadota bacterium]